MFDIKEVSSVEAPGRGFWTWVTAAGSVAGTTWLVCSIPAILAC